jgi:hypothetical protein
MLPKMELYVLVSSKRDVHGFILGTCNQSIGLCDDPQCLITLFISYMGKQSWMSNLAATTLVKSAFNSDKIPPQVVEVADDEQE